jgi:hypothetical protein
MSQAQTAERRHSRLMTPIFYVSGFLAGVVGYIVIGDSGPGDSS